MSNFKFRPALTLSLASLASLSSFGALAADGTVSFKGKVTDKTCTVSTASKDLVVTLPTVTKSTLATAGSVTGRTPFTINLTNCSTGSVATYFEPGSTVDATTGRLVNQSTSTSAATNVQLQLLGSNSLFIPVQAVSTGGAQTNSQWVTVAKDGDAADMHYFAEYYATAAATTGEVTSSVKYSIIYN